MQQILSMVIALGTMDQGTNISTKKYQEQLLKLLFNTIKQLLNSRELLAALHAVVTQTMVPTKYKQTREPGLILKLQLSKDQVDKFKQILPYKMERKLLV